MYTSVADNFVLTKLSLKHKYKAQQKWTKLKLKNNAKDALSNANVDQSPCVTSSLYKQPF